MRPEDHVERHCNACEPLSLSLPIGDNPGLIARFHKPTRNSKAHVLTEFRGQRPLVEHQESFAQSIDSWSLSKHGGFDPASNSKFRLALRYPGELLVAAARPFLIGSSPLSETPAQVGDEARSPPCEMFRSALRQIEPFELVKNPIGSIGRLHIRNEISKLLALRRKSSAERCFVLASNL